ncbi:MAG: helix-turn-helix domain-containing protein [Rhodobacteraceae bacterium]|nr:helix-turn-helix domain-containing protein [Paracoccaceae bacterium]
MKQHIETTAQVESDRASLTSTRTLRILKLLGSSGTPISIAEISQTMSIERNAVRRSLISLENEGFAYKIPGKNRYAISRSILSLLNKNTTFGDASKIILENLTLASEAVGFPCTFDTLEASSVVIEKIIDPNNEEESLEYGVGSIIPIHCSSAGRMMIASRFQDIAGTLPNNFERCTDRTLTEKSAVFQKAMTEYDRGYAYAQDEWIDGVSCTGVAISGANNKTLGAICVGGPTSILTRNLSAEIGPFLSKVISPLISRKLQTTSR